MRTSSEMQYVFARTWPVKEGISRPGMDCPKVIRAACNPYKHWLKYTLPDNYFLLPLFAGTIATASTSSK
jgi:hypothetical protein